MGKSDEERFIKDPKLQVLNKESILINGINSQLSEKEIEKILENIGAAGYSAHDYEVLHRFLLYLKISTTGTEVATIALEHALVAAKLVSEHTLFLAEGSAGVLGVAIISISAILDIIKAYEMQERFFGMRAAAYAATSWAFEAIRPSFSARCFQYLQDSTFVSEEKKADLYAAWEEAVDQTYAKLNEKHANNKFEAQGLLRVLGENKDKTLAWHLMIGMDKYFEGIWLQTWQALHSGRGRVEYPD